MDHNIIRVAYLQLEAKSYKRQAENKENIFRFLKKAVQSKPDLIVLPECIFPCYFLSPRIIGTYEKLASLTEQFLKEIKMYAKKYKTFIAVGIPEYIKENKTLYNSAILINDEGSEVGSVKKSFLWHFDNKWFSKDDQYPVFKTKIGKIGMFICADGRLPEITRCLALQGAEILLDLTNWVTSGLDRKTWSNPQVEYMVPTRALENKVWIVAANKVGFEEKTIQYCGKSSIFSPEGKIMAIASTDKEEILIGDIDLSLSHDKTISGTIDVFKDRRSEQYHLLTLPYEKLAIRQNKTKTSKDPFAAVIQIQSKSNQSLQEYMKKIAYFFHTLIEQDVDILTFSQNNNIPLNQTQEILNQLKDLTRDCPALCSIVLKEQEGSSKFKTIFLIESGKMIGKYRKTHLEISEKNTLARGNDLPIFETNFGYIGLMLDYEGYFPEIARILTLKGAQMIIWPCQFSQDEQIKIGQTRSAENKVFLICPNSIQKQFIGHSIITSPSGQIIAGCLENSEMASMSKISINLAEDKIIVPYTDAILDRQPESYHLLTTQKKI
jgi:predicted amidohydrolase